VTVLGELSRPFTLGSFLITEIARIFEQLVSAVKVMQKLRQKVGCALASQRGD
jgi:hypothetical protein